MSMSIDAFEEDDFLKVEAQIALTMLLKKARSKSIFNRQNMKIFT